VEISELKKSLPRYRSHKVVSAAKIITLKTWPDGVIDVTLVDPEKNEYKVRMPADWNRKHMPDKGGYLVAYEDNYVSYSPTEAFEKGNTLLTENEGSEI